MVRAKIKGVNTVRKRLADGTVRTYHYHRATGAALPGKPGDPAFLAAMVEAERIASLLKALSDPTRLRLLSHVAAQGCNSVCACDLTEPLGISQPTVSHHMKKLVDVEAPLATFLASGVLSLGSRLGPLLWQLPPNLGFHPDRLAGFFDLLPRRTSDASAFAATHHDASKLKEPADLVAPTDQPLRHVLEVRQ